MARLAAGPVQPFAPPALETTPETVAEPVSDPVPETLAELVPDPVPVAEPLPDVATEPAVAAPLDLPVAPRPPSPSPTALPEPDLAPVEAARATATLVEDRPDPSAEMDDTPPGARRRHSTARNTVEWVVIIGAALLAAFLIKTYLLQAFYIPSSSMEPTLEIQDRVLVNKLSYRLHDVHRGDVVVFERPPNDVGQIRDLIKRVVGLPGETVEGKNGSVFVDGRQLREPYLPKGTVTGQFGPQHIPEGYVWVMGDNRGNSSDSRVFGAISETRIIGRAFVRVWPVSALSLL